MYDNTKTNEKLPLECYNCGETFYKLKRIILAVKRGDRGHNGKYCSIKCSRKHIYPKIVINCGSCGKIIHKRKKELNKSKSGKLFCSKSCATLYNNTNKKHGTRKSKLESWLEVQLPLIYPKLTIHYNHKNTINSELDIYVPSIKLGFELNGIFHYEPIFGEKKLSQIENNDKRKFQACLERGIELCIIDTSKQKYFNVKSSMIYFEIIQKIIDDKLLTI